MSYNLSSVKERRNSLTIKKVRLLALIDMVERDDWRPGLLFRTNPETGVETWELENLGCEQEMCGLRFGDRLLITEMHLTGEGSGSLYNYFLESLFKQTEGEYSALWVWEGGDTVESVTITDGKISAEEVD